MGVEPASVGAADFNGDRQIELFLNDGSGIFVAGPDLSVGTELRPEAVAIGDLDADGDNDIASSTAATVGGFVTVFLNSGSATFAAPVNHDSEATDPSALVIADFDLAFGNDIAVVNGESQNPITGDSEWKIAILSNLGAASFGGLRLLEVGASPEALVAADLFGNGGSDLVSANLDEGTVSILQNYNVIFADGFEWGDTFPWSKTVPGLP